MPAVPELPHELEAALAQSSEARQNWEAAPPELQTLYIQHVTAPRQQRIRKQRAADAALAARLGTLREHASGRSPSWWDVVGSYLPF